MFVYYQCKSVAIDRVLYSQVHTELCKGAIYNNGYYEIDTICFSDIRSLIQDL